MKKVITILFIFVVLLTGTTIRYSAHFCQGAYVASKLSITGKNATCGMKQEKSESKDIQFSSLMCVNEITSYTFIDNYVFSPKVADAGKHVLDLEFPLMSAPKIISVQVSPSFAQLPPGSPGPLKAESEVLCVFRI